MLHADLLMLYRSTIQNLLLIWKIDNIQIGLLRTLGCLQKQPNVVCSLRYCSRWLNKIVQAVRILFVKLKRAEIAIARPIAKHMLYGTTY